MATTEAIQAEEDDIARFALAGQGTLPAVGVALGLNRRLADGKEFNAEQSRTVTGLLESENRVNLVEGPAGTGKSSLLAKFDEGMRRKGTHNLPGHHRQGGRGAGRGRIRGAHRPHSWSMRSCRRAAVKRGGGVIVCDEASMLGHRDAQSCCDWPGSSACG